MRRSVPLLFAAVVLAVAAPVAPVAASAAPAPRASAAADQRWVLHEWIPQGPPLDLMLVHPDGSGLRPLMDPSPAPEADNQHADWSPDGARIAFEALFPDGTASVWTVAADGRDPRRVVSCQGPPCLQIAYPAWSPDGRSLLVVRYDVADDGSWADNWLEVVDLVTGARRAIARIPGDQSFYAPRWSPDGGRVVVEIDSYTDTSQSELTGTVVAVVNARGRGLHVPRPVTEPGLFAANPDWHPHLPLIVFATNDPITFRDSEKPSNIYTVSPSGRHLRRLTSSVDAAVRYAQPTFTPDGRQISLVVGRTDTSGARTWRPALLGLGGGAPAEIGVSGFRPRVQPRLSYPGKPR